MSDGGDIRYALTETFTEREAWEEASHFALEALARLEGERDDLHAVWKATERQLAEAEERSRLLAEALSVAQEFIDTMASRHSNIAGRLVPNGFTSDSVPAAVKLHDALAALAQAVDRTLEGER